MPLSELYRLANRRVDSNQDFETGNNDVFELIWENGQITTQGQSSRVRKEPACNSLPSHCLPSYNPKTRDKDFVGNGSNSNTTRAGKFGTVVDSVLNEIPMSVPSDEVGLSHDDDMIPWLNYPLEASPQREYCPEFLPELSGVTVHENSKSNNFAATNEKSTCNQLFRDSHDNSVNYSASLDQRNASKAVASGGGGGDVVRPRIGASQLYQASSSSQQCQSTFPSFRSRGSNTTASNSSSSVAHHAVCSDSARVASISLPSSKLNKAETLPGGNSSNLINFSHFSRPAGVARASSILHLSLDRMLVKDKACASRGSSPPSSKVRREGGLQSQTVDLKVMQCKTSSEPSGDAKFSEAVPREDVSKNDANSDQIARESTTRGQADGEKNTEPVVASSSVCSGNGVERVLDDPAHVLKRKFCDAEDSECHSEDIEEESVTIKKSGLPRASGSKRSRAAEVHNLSERRRRDRINEKMRALQELIPNCNKVDKASMLDEAIEYLKTLQLQVQIMSLGTGLCMPPMMLPTGLQHMHLPHLGHFPPMGIGMGMGLGMGFGMGMPDLNGSLSGYPMIPGPPLQGAHFPGPQMPGHNAALHGMGGPNMPVFGLHGQGIAMPMQRPPLMPPMMGMPFMKPSTAVNPCGAVDNMDPTAQLYTLKDAEVQNTEPNCSLSQPSTQRQATNEGFEQTVLVQNDVQATNANASKASGSANTNDAGPSGAASYA